MDITDNPQPLKRAHLTPIVAGVIGFAGLFGIIALATAGDGQPAAGTQAEVCTERRVDQIKYVKEIRERGRIGKEWSAWTPWAVYNNGSVTRWEDPGFAAQGLLIDEDDYQMEYRYVPTSEVTYVDVEVPCLTDTTEVTPSTDAATTTTAAATTTAAPGTTTTSPTATTTPAAGATTTTTQPAGTTTTVGSVLPNPQETNTAIVVCREGQVITIDVADQLDTDTLDLDHCEVATPATGGGLPSTE